MEIHDYQRQILLNYTLTGDYLSKTNIGYNFLSFVFHESDYIFFTAKHESFIQNEGYFYDLLVTRDNELVKKYLPYNPLYYGEVRIHSRNPFLIHNSKLLFSDLLSDTVFSVSRDTIYPEFIFTYKNESLPSHLTKSGHSKLIEELNAGGEGLRKYDFNASLVSGNEKCLVYSYIHQMNKHHGFYSIGTGNTREFSFESTDLNLAKILAPLFVEDEKFVTVVPLYVLEKLLLTP